MNGLGVSDALLHDIEQQVTRLIKKHIIPHLVIILIGKDPASLVYVSQKQQKAEHIGIKTTLIQLPESTTEESLIRTIKAYNTDRTVHGIIVQRPLSPHIHSTAVTAAISPIKDIDAFHLKSPYYSPIVGAVLKIFEEVQRAQNNKQSVTDWLQEKKVVVIGKGETGGGPIIQYLKNMPIDISVIDSKTIEVKRLLQQADIIISAVGKPNVIAPESIKKGVLLISIGLYKDSLGKLHGDYEKDQIKNIASFYTPTPKGIGPINVAMLLKNLLLATNKISSL